MAELDDQLRDAFARAAEPGDPSGVADAIRSRVAAGDTGTPATSSGFAGSPLGWLPWVGVIVVAGLVGGLVGVTGLAGRPQVEHLVGASFGVLDDAAPAFSCVGGAPERHLPAGERVLATSRSEDSSWLGVRDPVTLTDTIWVDAGQVVVDGGASTDSLPVGGACAVASVVTDAPPPVEVIPVTPETPQTPDAPDNPPPPAPDTTAPSVGKVTVQWTNCQFTVTTTATDDVGVAGVSISWTGVHPGSGVMQNQGGGVWTFDLSGSNNVWGGNYTFTATATDAAGNAGSNQSPVTNIQCLI